MKYEKGVTVVKKRRFRKNKISVMCMLSILLLITGCVEKNGEELGAESSWEVGQSELSAKIGNLNRTSGEILPPPYHYFDDYIEIMEKTEYDMPTKKWFIHDDEGEFGYGISSGTMKAGDQYAIKLFPKDDKQLHVNRDIRIQLTTRDSDSQRSELVMEKTFRVDTIQGETEIYSQQLPDKENVIYLLSVEMLDQQGQVEDTMVRMIYVPVPEVNAQLVLNKAVYKASEEQAVLTLENAGPTFLYIGEYIIIEKKVNDQWKVVPLDMEFPDISTLIPIGDTYSQTVAIDALTAGEYRVIKSFYADGLDITTTLAAEFTIDEDL